MVPWVLMSITELKNGKECILVNWNCNGMNWNGTEKFLNDTEINHNDPRCL